MDLNGILLASGFLTSTLLKTVLALCFAEFSISVYFALTISTLPCYGLGENAVPSCYEALYFPRGDATALPKQTQASRWLVDVLPRTWHPKL